MFIHKLGFAGRLILIHGTLVKMGSRLVPSERTNIHEFTSGWEDEDGIKDGRIFEDEDGFEDGEKTRICEARLRILG